MTPNGKGFLIFFIIWTIIFFTLPGYGFIGGTTYTLGASEDGKIKIGTGLMTALLTPPKDKNEFDDNIRDNIKKASVYAILGNLIYSFLITSIVMVIWRKIPYTSI